MFRNTLTANDKYPVRDCENFLSSIEIQFSLKPKSFFDFFLDFLESTSNFRHPEKNDDRHSYFFLESTDYQRLQ